MQTNFTKVYDDPKNRCFSSELKTFDTETLIKRRQQIEKYFDWGIPPEWTAIITSSDSHVHNGYWVVEELLRYRKLLLMELLDRCKSFELIPKIEFKF